MDGFPSRLFCQVLGDKDIICVEDLVHEIFTVGPNFKQVGRCRYD